MNNIKWLELINEKEEEILAAGEEAYKEALNNTNLQYIVEINEDGEVYTWYDIAGRSVFHASTYNGTSIEVLHFCNRYYKPEITDESIEIKLEEKGYASMIDELRERAKEDRTSIESIIMSGDCQELQEVVEECRQDEIDFMVSEYAREETKDKLENLRSQLEEAAEREEKE